MADEIASVESTLRELLAKKLQNDVVLEVVDGHVRVISRILWDAGEEGKAPEVISTSVSSTAIPAILQVRPTSVIRGFHE